MPSINNYNNLSSSPASVASPLFINRNLKSSPQLTLEEFIDLLPAVIRERQNSPLTKVDKKDTDTGSTRPCTDIDPVTNLFRRLVFNQNETSQYSHVDPLKNYTRNLVATDNETFTLLLLCWNPLKQSPIHDHPCDGCWMRVLQGSINEKRYIRDSHSDALACTQDSTFMEGDETFISDNLGYHKIGNEGEEIALSLHLYSPPFGECRVWRDETSSSKSSMSGMCDYFSEYGELVYNSDE